MVKAWTGSGQSLALLQAGLRRASQTKKNPACQNQGQAGCVDSEESRAHAKDPRPSSLLLPRPTALTYDIRSEDCHNTPLARSDAVQDGFGA